MKESPRINKVELGAAGMFAALLVAWIFYQNIEGKKIAEARAAQRAAMTNRVVRAEAPALPADTALTATAEPAAENVAPAPLVASDDDLPRPDEEFVELENDTLRLSLTSHGGAVHASTLLQYPAQNKRDGAPVAFDYAANPVLAWSGLPGFAPSAAYEILERGATSAVFFATNAEGTLAVTRRYELKPDHTLAVRDTFQNTGAAAMVLPAHRVALGALPRIDAPSEVLTADILALGSNKVWRCEKDILAGLGVGGGLGGCGGNQNALRDRAELGINGPGSWVAFKSRFFVHFFACDPGNSGLGVVAEAKLGAPARVDRVSGNIAFAPALLEPGAEITRATTVYIGPKRYSTIKTLGPQSGKIMEFDAYFLGSLTGLICPPLLWLLNFFYLYIPNYGIAIILLTFFVRGIFWPLTHKTAESSRRMAALQPKVKEIQAKFKDNPQKLQQETWALYREHKVNPLSSCLPMLVQLPVFIALFTMLRSVAELRFESFLWISDLSEAENLFADVLPIPLNILPILMSGTMVLQSYLMPGMGDPTQRKMMMIMMPIMMLFMLYTFASALALYWTVSNLIAIAQLYAQKRRAARDNAAASPPPPDDDAKPTTRQMRRRLGRA